MSTDHRDTDGTDPIGPVEELRWLADTLRGLDRAASAAQWGDDAAMARAVADAHAELASAEAVDAAGGDLGASAASGAAEAVVAVGRARRAVAEAVLAVDRARRLGDETPADGPRWTRQVGTIGARVRDLGGRIAQEIRHVAADRPRSVLARTVITLAISLALVTAYDVTGMKRYDLSGLTIYLFSAVIGSVVCTNALCFEADRVRAALASGERIWRVLVAKNMAMATLITAAGLPVVAALAWTVGTNPVVLVDQLITMVFIWLGVGNVLSVVYPLRHEPVTARLRDGTWRPYLGTFAISYGVGLTVNLMIYWRLWAREAANQHLAGGSWMAFLLVLASAVFTWLLLTVFAVACGRQPAVRRKLSREMIAYRKPAKPLKTA